MMQRFSTSSFVIGVMLGIILAGAWFLGKDSPILPVSSFLADNDKGESLPVSGSIVVADQAAGPEVVVKSVAAPVYGIWVAIREVDEKDLGNVLGAARVSGLQTNIIVSLLRATEPSRPYAVELYRDDNNGAFDPSANSVYVDFDTGSRAVAYFKTTE